MASLKFLRTAADWSKISRMLFRFSFTLLLASASLCLATGCPPPDLGSAPFICNNGLPRCPLGYECRTSGGKEICVKEGMPLPKLDGLKDLASSDADAGLPGDGPGDLNMTDAEGGSGGDKGVATIKVIISEFMADPSAVSDDTGEWIELYNPSTQNININGWTLKDTLTDSHKLKNSGPLFVPAKGYLVLGRTTNTSQNGGTPVAYAYENFLLSNSSDEIMLLNEKMQVVDSFAYNTNTGYQITAGSSLSLKSPGLDKTVGTNWCVETSPWQGSQGDRGTPLKNPNCQ